MIVYPDGIEARVGDNVALAHGQQTGVVMHVLELAEDLSAWDLDEPGLMIDTSWGGYAFYPQLHLSAGEIVFKSRAET